MLFDLVFNKPSKEQTDKFHTTYPTCSFMHEYNTHLHNPTHLWNTLRESENLTFNQSNACLFLFVCVVLFVCLCCFFVIFVFLLLVVCFCFCCCFCSFICFFFLFVLPSTNFNAHLMHYRLSLRIAGVQMQRDSLG